MSDADAADAPKCTKGIICGTKSLQTFMIYWLATYQYCTKIVNATNKWKKKKTEEINA